MSDPKIVASAKNQRSPGAMPQDSRRSWLILGWIGLVFLVVGGMDFALVWLPLNFGNAEWEFATVTQSFNGLPILLLGLGLLAVTSELADRPWWGLLALAAAALWLVWVLVGCAFWAMNVQLALSTAPAGIAVEVRQAVMKTLVQTVVYGAILAYVTVRQWKALRG